MEWRSDWVGCRFILRTLCNRPGAHTTPYDGEKEGGMIRVYGVVSLRCWPCLQRQQCFPQCPSITPCSVLSPHILQRSVSPHGKPTADTECCVLYGVHSLHEEREEAAALI